MNSGADLINFATSMQFFLMGNGREYSEELKADVNAASELLFRLGQLLAEEKYAKLFGENKEVKE